MLFYSKKFVTSRENSKWRKKSVWRIFFLIKLFLCCFKLTKNNFYVIIFISKNLKWRKNLKSEFFTNFLRCPDFFLICSEHTFFIVWIDNIVALPRQPQKSCFGEKSMLLILHKIRHRYAITIKSFHHSEVF
jgi:hypothetical protein